MNNMTANYEILPLTAFVTHIKNLTIPIEYVREDNGSWSCWTKPRYFGLMHTHGTGATLDEALDDYVDALKDIAECIYQENLPDEHTSAEYLAKILMSSKEELKQCLNGKICEDS